MDEKQLQEFISAIGTMAETTLLFLPEHTGG